MVADCPLARPIVIPEGSLVMLKLADCGASGLHVAVMDTDPDLFVE